MNKTLRATLDIIVYLVVFMLIQAVFTLIVGSASVFADGGSWSDIIAAISGKKLALSGQSMAIMMVLSSLLTLILFAKLGWGPVSKHWLRTKPYGVLVWAAIAALGSILPSEWLVEKMEYTMPEAMEQMFEQIMGEPVGYLSIGILAPLAEEIVFRGAILRKLLGIFGDRWHWVAIAVSAVIFGAVHGNWPQFVHAALLGLLLGWMYCRTGSILPGIMLHWVNNTVAYVMFNIMPQMADGKLIDLFHGNERMMVLGLIFSLFIFIPSLLQLHMRMKK